MAIFGVIKGGRSSAPQPRTDGSMTDLLDYEIFTRVIKAGSLSAAARELHSTPAMISKRLTRLEDRLGVKLLHRTTRRLTPTEVGQAFYERVLAVLAAVEDAESLATIDNERPRGLLRISLPTSFGRLHVAPKLKSFLDTFPELRLLVDLNDEYADLAAGGFDVAVRIGTLKRVLPAFSGAADVNIYAVYAGRRLVPPKVRAFVDYFASAFGPDLPYWDRDVTPALERVANVR